MFKITEFTEVHLATFTKREETHGDEKVAAVSVTLELTGANTLLDAIDPAIRHALYKAVEGQDQLPGVEPATTVLRCNSFEKHTLSAAHEGWSLAVDDGIDETKPMLFGGCKVDRLVVEAKQGGSIVLRFRVGTSDLDAERLGMLHGHSMWITLLPPEKKPDAIDGSAEGYERDRQRAAEDGQGDLLDPDSPEAALADAVGRTPEPEFDGHGGPDDDGSAHPNAARGKDWPFPTGGAATDEEIRAQREQEELEAGMAQSIAAAGVTEKRTRRGRAAAGVE